MDFTNTLNVDCLDIITSYLTVGEYKHINIYFNKAAKEKAAILIFKHINIIHNNRIYIESKIDEIVFQYFISRDRHALDNISDTMINTVMSYYKKCIPITKRNEHNCNILIHEQVKYIYEYINEYINISHIRVEYDMAEVYENNIEMNNLQLKLASLKLQFKKEYYCYKDNLEYIFCNKLIKENFSLESATFHIENMIYINVVDFLASKHIRLNHFCDEYIIFSFMKDLSIEIKQAYTDSLNSICYLNNKNKKTVNFNKLVDHIEPEVLIENIHIFQ